MWFVCSAFSLNKKLFGSSFFGFFTEKKLFGQVPFAKSTGGKVLSIPGLNYV